MTPYTQNQTETRGVRNNPFRNSKRPPSVHAEAVSLITKTDSEPPTPIPYGASYLSTLTHNISDPISHNEAIDSYLQNAFLEWEQWVNHEELRLAQLSHSEVKSKNRYRNSLTTPRRGKEATT